jgi:hypothetical protein
MGGARFTYGRQGRFVLRFGRERGTWEDIGIVGRIILNQIFKNWGDLDWIDLAWVRDSGRLL